MPEANDVDLPRRRINRGPGNGDADAPRRHSDLILYIAGGTFLALSLYFFFRSALKSDPVVEVTTVSLMSRGRATSTLSAGGYGVAGADTTATLVLDSSAITRRDGRSYAFTVRDDVATGVGVQTGATLGRFVEIRSGLASGDRVILKPPADLHTGTRVKTKG